MLERVAHHYVGIKLGSERKYRILAEAQRKGHPIEFDVLYYAESNRKRDILNEIGEKEGEYIRAYRPILNTQIPKEEDFLPQKVPSFPWGSSCLFLSLHF